MTTRSPFRFVCGSVVPLFLVLSAFGCGRDVIGLDADQDPTPLPPASRVCPGADAVGHVLVDAGKDGGVWWYPQSGPFDPDADHQGKPLADYLRGLGYVVTEMGRGVRMTDSLALAHRIIIRANGFNPSYTEAELAAYRAFLVCPTTLVLLSDHQAKTYGYDAVAGLVGVGFTGVSGNEQVTSFGRHAITDGVTSLRYMVGAHVDARDASRVQFLGWLAGGQPVMGISTVTTAKVFFLGDTNTLEALPQPLLDNLIRWGF